MQRTREGILLSRDASRTGNNKTLRTTRKTCSIHLFAPQSRQRILDRKLVDAALAGDAKRSLKILAGLRAEGIEPVIVVWSLTRELRILASLADAIAQGMDLASGMRNARIWNNRQSLVRSCVARHQPGDFHKLLKATNLADQAAKGQTYADPWQVATEIVLGLSLGRRKAA